LAKLPLGSGPAREEASQVPARPVGRHHAERWFVYYGTNAEMRWDAVPGLGYTTPNERFFVRDHTATPVIDVQTWQLQVFGSGLHGPGAGRPWLPAVVPGWVGVANIKWVGQIEVSDQPLFSLWNTQQHVLTGDAYPDKPGRRTAATTKPRPACRPPQAA